MGALDHQVGGRHYVRHVIQPIELISAARYDFFQGSILKYLSRWREKGGVGDIDKCMHYVRLRGELIVSNSLLTRIGLWAIGTGWRLRNRHRSPITMQRYIDANGFPEVDHGVLHGLNVWVQGAISDGAFIHHLELYKEKVSAP